MKIVLNGVIVRKNGGGATQIVYNYIIATLKDTEVDWYYIISEEFLDLISDTVNINSSHWLVLPRQPQIKTYLSARRAINKFLDYVKPDIVYSILAPSYFRFNYAEVMRCCNAWDVIEKNDEVFSFINRKTRLKYKVKTCLVRILMKRADYFITQTKVAKDGILRVTRKTAEDVVVIPNVLPLYFQSVNPEHQTSDTIDIIYVASPVPHKNLAIVPEVASILKNDYGLKKFRFILTIPSEDSGVAYNISKRARELLVDKEIINIGGKTQKELVDLYNTASVGFFPSVLETFSATLLEYMYFKLPIVASDRPFNTEVLENAALYFRSTDAHKAADEIFSIVTNREIKDTLIFQSEQRIKMYLDYNEHYDKSIAFFKKIIELKKNK